MEETEKECWQVIGIVDSYGAVHCEKLYGFDFSADHNTFWRGRLKRWRFYVYDWKLDTSCLGDNLDPEDVEAVMNKMRKILPIPLWVQKNDAWEAAGRPHGKAGDKFEKSWNKAHPQNS